MKDSEPRHTGTPSTEDELYAAIGALVADAGLSVPAFLRRVISDTRATPHSRRALSNFHRFLVTGFSSTWLRDFDEHHLLQQILLELFSQSQFLADVLVRNPELFRWLTSSQVLTKSKTIADYRQEVGEAVGMFQRQEKKIDSLKRFQRRELLRIGARQVLKEADVLTTSSELSALADSIIEAVLGLAYDHVADSAQADQPRDLAVIGLGKLGGGELNFSSDIDLMFVYDKDGPLEVSVGRLSTLHEYYVRVSEFVVRRLSEHTGEGHFYRVDMRLRPDGSSGPLAMSRAAYFAYYEARGEAWERQMLIKARVLAGNITVGERWLADLQPYIYPKTILTSPLDEIARMKAKIESKIGDETNIKLGSGGIRDIEFSVQALQLLNGGANVQIRQRGSAAAIQSLVLSLYLKEREGKGLRAAYIFLRTVEDRLQLLHGLQKHALPESTEERTILARQLGYKSVAAFSTDLRKHQETIRKTYQSIFEGTLKGKQARKTDSVETSLDLRVLRKSGFVDPAGAARNIREILDLFPEFRDHGRLQTLLAVIHRHGAPDWCLGNLLVITNALPLRRSLQQVFSNERALEFLTLLCSRTSKFAAILSKEPLLFESMVGRPEDLLSAGRGWEFLRHSDLARYRTYNQFKAVARYVVGETGIRGCTAELSDLAEELISESFESSVQETPGARDVTLVVLALGKLGGGEISIGSDLDIVFLYKERTGRSDSKTAVAVGRMLREHLEGVYEVDFRLRPEGKNSPLATEYEYYKRYLLDRASLWERQSLARARVIAGDPTFMDELDRHVKEFVYQTPLPRNWIKDILLMRQRMAREHTRKDKSVNLKTGEGGLADIEFLVQVLQLRYGHKTPLIVRSNTFDALEEIQRAGILKKSDSGKAMQNLDSFRRLEAFVRLNSELSDFVLPSDKPRLQAVAAAMRFPSGAALITRVDRLRRENHALFTSTLKKQLI